MRQSRQTLFFCGLFLLLGAIPAYRSSPTYDEMGFMAAGLIHWDLGLLQPYSVNPPLIRLLATLPVYLCDSVMNWGQLSLSVSPRMEYSNGIAFVANNTADVQVYFWMARMVCLSVSLVGLVTAIRWSETLFGPRSSRLVGWMWCLSPMMVGHASLITPDAGAASFGLLAAWWLRGWLRQSTVQHALTMGAGVGLAIGCKLTWLALMPALFVVVWVVWRSVQRQWRSRFGRDLAHIVSAVAACIVVLNLVYMLDRTCQPLGEIELRSAGVAAESDTGESKANRFSGT